MRFSGLSEIRAYWEALRGTAALPRRSDFDPRGIERALPQAFLAARRGPGGALAIRIAGQQICTLAGRDLSGADPEVLLCPSDRAALRRMFDEVLDSPALAELDLDHPAAGGTPKAARLVLLPLADAAGRAGYVLGGLALLHPVGAGEAGPAPLALRRARLTRLSARSEAESGPAIPRAPAALPCAPPAGLSEDSSPFVPATPARRHLRVVK